MILSTQLKISARKGKDKRWDDRYKVFALRILYHSPKAYRGLKKFLDFPSISTLQLFVRSSFGPMVQGINPSVMELLRLRCSTMNEHKCKCSLVFDEISIMKHTAYNKNKGTVIGLTEEGEPADHVLVFTARGLSTVYTVEAGICIFFHTRHHFCNKVEQVDL